MSNNKIKVCVVGATGYVGLDLVFLLSKHKKISIKYLCAQKNLGKKISFFDKRINKNLPKISSIKKINFNNIDLVFLSLPNGEAQKFIKKYFYYKNIKFIDLSADFRIEDKNKYKKWYRQTHSAPKFINKSLYSITELSKNKIKNHRIIANPGCYPTSIQIPLIPLIRKKLINYNNIIIDSKSGYSGAGKNFKKKFNHKNLFFSIQVYGIKNHRHTSELEQEFKKNSKSPINFTFNPQLLPVFRGILSSIHVEVRKKININKIHKELKLFYKNSKFIKINKINKSIGTGSVINTNNCEISVCESRVKNKLVIFSAIDNLIKGASGQAIQNMNIMYNFKENEGLK
ncbi:MAG: N-acetyl-gamma-glutamyl-phosphate reductase [Pelagibacteraceae bacterium TMED287]|nr:MAG: N-acetyl-gamma-glutamyl-phosphate reductase [Pelagibacteraceae bacterium TMED287]